MQVDYLQAHLASPRLVDANIESVRLIDDGMMHYEASLAGLAERYGRGTTSHTIHVWWARRPHTAMRALVFASLCKEVSDDTLEILKTVGAEVNVSPSEMKRAGELLIQQYGKMPRLLDMFSGGGTIPLEGGRLGAETHSCDANELSVFIQRCNLEYSQGFSTVELTKDIRNSGIRVLQQLMDETAPLFPLRKHDLLGLDGSSIYGYVWTYSLRCPTCDYKFFLTKRPWLSKKKTKRFGARRIAYVSRDCDSGQRIEIETLSKGENTPHNVWVGRQGILECPKCHVRHSDISIKRCKDELVALIKPTKPSGKTFIAPCDTAVPPHSVLRTIEEDALKQIGMCLPETKLPKWSGIVNPALYGVESHSDFLNPRQRAVLLLLIKALRDEFSRLCAEKDSHYARCIIGLLSSLVDQVVDWNCRLSMWIPENEQVGRAFSGPGVAMLWDYAETDQLLGGPANLWSKLERIIEGVKSIPRFACTPKIRRAYAQELPYENDYFDAIVTDPPYYDNIYYSILADFFYVWKRPVMDLIDSISSTTALTDRSRELVASRNRNGTAEKAHKEYLQQLTQALKEAERVLKPNGVFVLVYSHGSFQGWEAIVQSYRGTSLVINSVQPLSIERRQRPRAMTSEATNTCIAIVARRNQAIRQPISPEYIRIALTERYIPFADALVESGWNASDAGLAAFTNAVGLLANASGISDEQIDDLEALRMAASIIRKHYPTFSMKNRKPL